MSNTERNDLMNLEEVTDIANLHLEKPDDDNALSELTDFCFRKLNLTDSSELYGIVTEIRRKDLFKTFTELREHK